MTPLSQFEAHWPAINALLDEALNLPPDERARWLDGLIGERAAHRDALRALLAHQADVETDDFLSTLPRLEARHLDPPGDAPKPGAQVGGYRLIAEIGQGGMGTVWLAERRDAWVHRRVALKLPRRTWGDGLAERLARERDILATLEHPHIARFHDAGVDASGRPFLAMEFVDGDPIDVHCRTHALSVRDRIALLLQVMAAVAHAHARLVVHRDLKPGNILVTPDGQAKLLDFGIAKLLEGGHAQRSALTELNGRPLTPEYASPEQIRGEPMGTGADVYALGVVAYELLAGERPYRLQRGSAAEIEDAVAHAEPRRASDAAVTPALKKQLRGDLDAILNRALKKSVDARYPSAEAFAQDLARHCRGEPVLARPDSAAYRATRFLQRHRVASAMTAALALSVLVGGGLALWQADVARRQERLAAAEADRQRAVRDLYVDAMTRLSVMGAESPEGLARPQAVTTTLRDTLAALAPRFDAHPAGREAQLEAVMLQLNYASQFEASLDVGRDYLAALKAQRAAPDLVIDAHTAIGRTLYQLQRYDDSEAVRREGLAWAPGADEPRARLARLVVTSELGGILTAQGKRDEAEVLLQRAGRDAEREFPQANLRHENRFQLSVFWLGFDDAKALQLAQQARAGQVATGTAEPGQVAHGLQYLGNALLANGRAAEAEAAWREARHVTVSLYGRASTHGVRALARVVDAVARQGDVARAEALMSEERGVLSRLPGGMPPYAARQFQALQLQDAWLAGDVPRAKGLLAEAAADANFQPGSSRDHEGLVMPRIRALEMTGDVDGALALLRAVQDRWPDAGRPTAAWLRWLETQARLEFAAGRPADARRVARGLVALLDAQRVSHGRLYVAAVELEALANARLGHRAEAARGLDRIGAAARSLPYPSRVERAEAWLRRAELLQALGRDAEAASAAREADAEAGAQHPGSPRLARARGLAALDVRSR